MKPMHFLIMTSIVLVCSIAFAQDYKKDNLAPLAQITANAQNGKGDFGAYHVADGVFPEAVSWNDAHGAWVVFDSADWRESWLEFRWEQPVKIAEIHYYIRTAFFSFSNFQEYELYVDGAESPLMTGKLLTAFGTQRLTLPEPVMASKIRLVLKGEYIYQPGVNEIEIYSEPIPEELTERVIEIPRGAMAVKPLDFEDEKHRAMIESEESRKLKTDFFEGRLGFDSLVMIRRHHLNPSHVYTYHNEGFVPGGGLYICRLNDGELEIEQLVDAGEGEILDVDVSYDGRELLFSWKQNAEDTFHVYRINVDGSGLTKLTDGESYSFNAVWLPDGGIGFLSTRKPAFAYCFTSPVATLYRMDRDGGNVIRLSANYLNDFTPTVLDNGQIIYSRWEYVDRPAIPIQSLWTINPDGTKLQGYYGNRVLSPATFMEPRQIPGTEKILCLLTAHNGPCRGGLGIIDISYGDNTQQALTNITPEVKIDPVDKGHGNDVAGYWENAYPLDDEVFIASYMGQIVLRDYEGQRLVPVTQERCTDGLGWFSPQPIRFRFKPPVLASSLPKGDNVEPWASVFLQDVYLGLKPHVKRGEVKRLAIVQEIEKPRLADASKRTFGFQFPVVSCSATYAPKKIWGYADVAENGSASFRVPSNVPFYFMALDRHGRALQRMRTFTHFMPGERQSCIGCHEPRDAVPNPDHMKKAMGAAVQTLQEPEWGVRGFDYARIVQPILDKHCVSCHSGANPPRDLDLSGDKTDFFNVSYEHLARKGTQFENWMDGRGDYHGRFSPYTKWICTANGNEANILQITPKFWGSPASLLADIVLKGHPNALGRKRIQLQDDEKRRIYAWIDLNVPYYPTSTSNHPEKPGCRRIYPSKLDEVIEDVAQRRCISCHGINADGKARIPREFWTRITNPQKNSFLTAPLAKSQGGTEKCGKIVFESTDDPDYKAILATFEETTQLIKETPRMDMGDEPVQLQKCKTDSCEKASCNY